MHTASDVIQEMAYKQGIVDLLEPYDVESIEELIENVRNKAIDECIKILTDDCKCEYEKITCFECMAIKMEQLKG